MRRQGARKLPLGGVNQPADVGRLFCVGLQCEVFPKMMDGLDWILDVIEVDETGFEVRLGGGLLAAFFDHLEKGRQRLRVTPLPHELLALPVIGFVGLRRERHIFPAAAAGAEEQRGGGQHGNVIRADSHLAGNGIERAVVRRKFATSLRYSNSK